VKPLKPPSSGDVKVGDVSFLKTSEIEFDPPVNIFFPRQPASRRFQVTLQNVATPSDNAERKKMQKVNESAFFILN
jgi:hypothetical protein